MVERIFLFGNKSNLPETRDENKLYFCSDTKELYKGQDLFTEAVRIVEELPENMAQGVLYVLPSGEVKVYNGTDTTILFNINNTDTREYILSDEGISEENTDEQIATAKAVYDFVINTVSKVEVDAYTKEEVDAIISAVEQDCDWKESVDTFDNIATTYPEAEAGWTVSVKDTNIIYRYNGTEWVDIFRLINKSQLGLENVDNTSDLNKPISTATQTALDNKMNKENPTGTGSLSMNRQVDTVIGQYSTTLGSGNTASGDYSYAEGSLSKAEAKYAHAEGNATSATGEAAHSEGYNATASGNYSHAEGRKTTASKDNAHAEGAYTTASGGSSHAEGDTTFATGANSHAEGNVTRANGLNSHAEGYCTTANGENQHVQGKFNAIDNNNTYAHIVGGGTSDAYTDRKNIHTLDWDGNADFAGDVTATDSEGNKVSLVELANSGAELEDPVTVGTFSMNRKIDTVVGEYSTTLGSESTASGYASLAEGKSAAVSNYSHSEGEDSTSSGIASHAEGYNTIASGDYSHAQGTYTIAAGENQNVQGKYNIEDTEDTYAHIVGGGTSEDDRKNIYTLDWDGNAEFAGDVTATDSEGNKVSLLNKADKDHTHTKEQLELENVDNTSDLDKPVSTATQAALDNNLATAKEYTDTKVANLVGTAPQTLDTLQEVAQAIQDNEDVSIALNEAIGNKVDKQDLDRFMLSENPEGTGSFSMNRLYGSTIGTNSVNLSTPSYSTISGISGDANTTTYTISSWNSNLAIGKVVSYNDIYATITAIDQTNRTFTLDKTLSSDTVLSSVSIKIYTGGIASGNYSHSEGYGTTASGSYSHSEGLYTTASGDYSHSEGYGTNTTISGISGDTNVTTYTISSWNSRLTIGRVVSYNNIYAKITAIDKTNLSFTLDKTLSSTVLDNVSMSIYTGGIASGDYSHSEGSSTIASGEYSHSEGSDTIAIGNYSHAEGYDTTANGSGSHSEGSDTIAIGDRSHAEGQGLSSSISGISGDANATTYTLSSWDIDLAIGRVVSYNNIYAKITAIDQTNRTFTLDKTLSSTVLSSVSIKIYTGGIASGDYSHSEGYLTTASGENSHAEGERTTASGNSSHVEGSYNTASGEYSHAEGYSTKAIGNRSHAEGTNTTASGQYSHSEGISTKANGFSSHAEGSATIAIGQSSHAEGRGSSNTISGISGDTNATTYTISSWNSKLVVGRVVSYNNIYAKITAVDQANLSFTLDKTLSSTALSSVSISVYTGGIASGEYSHSEGYDTTASGDRSHAEGANTIAGGQYSHVEGYYTYASSNYQHVQGKYNIEDTNNTYAHIVGGGTSEDDKKNIHTIDWEGNAEFAGDVTATDSEGNKVSLVDLANNSGSGSGDYLTTNNPVGTGSLSMNRLYGSTVGTNSVNLSTPSSNTISGISGDANTTTYTISSWNSKLVVGRLVIYNDIYATITAIDQTNLSFTLDKTLSSDIALSNVSIKIYIGGIASGNYSHSEGLGTTASGSYSHSEGAGTEASGNYSHAEGYYTTASGNRSHAEGANTIASGQYSHVEGVHTTASGNYSHAEGFYTTSSGDNQHVQGKYNIEDTNNTYAHIVGGGTSEDDRKNIHTIDWDGNAEFAGDVTATDSEGNKVSLVELANNPGSVSGDYLTTENPTGTGSLSMNRKADTSVGTLSSTLGNSNTANGYGSHAQGNSTTSSGTYTHTEGGFTKASGTYSHAEGFNAEVSGKYSHAEGRNTLASSENQHVQGKYNIEDTTNTYAHIVGNGTSATDRSNAHTIDWNGNADFAGDVTATDSEGNKVSLVELANNSGSGSGDYVPLSGGTMTGKLNFANGTTYYIDGSGNAKFNTITQGNNTVLDTSNYSSYAATKDHTHSGYATSGHTHSYAGSSSAGGAATSADKVNTNLVVKLNSGTTEGTNMFTFNGSTAKTVNITPSTIGAAASSHGNHVPATQTASNKIFLRNDNTWQTITPANIGAAASSHTHSGYASSSHTHSYLPLSGGTVTGAITASGGIHITGTSQLANVMNLGTTTASDGARYYINGNATGRFNALRYASSQALSSKRYKNNIEYKNNEYWHDVLMQIEPCTFYYNNDADTKHIGLIAEDLYELIPELVDIDDEGKPTSIEYANLSIPLIGEVQRLNKIIESLQERINILEGN